MPTSNLYLAPDLLALVQGTGAKTVLDVGPGHGKYGILLREYAQVETVDAVEAWEPYVDAFGLWGIYRTVFIADVCDLPMEALAAYDCVFMGDVLEHIPRDKAIPLLERIPGWVVICTPADFFPQPHEVPTEWHVSHWTQGDFPGADLVIEKLGGLMVRLRPKAVIGG